MMRQPFLRCCVFQHLSPLQCIISSFAMPVHHWLPGLIVQSPLSPLGVNAAVVAPVADAPTVLANQRKLVPKKALRRIYHNLDGVHG